MAVRVERDTEGVLTVTWEGALTSGCRCLPAGETRSIVLLGPGGQVLCWPADTPEQIRAAAWELIALEKARD